MVTLKKNQIDASIRGNEWDLGNEILYDMCRKYPKHNNKSEIIAKVWLIGRSYAAAIERRKHRGSDVFDGDDFYVEVVAPQIMESEIDDWLGSLRDVQRNPRESLDSILAVHLNVTELFFGISGLEKRSLASKYLHFHVPDLFFIYDSRAVTAVSHLSGIAGRVGRSKYMADNEYRKFCEKCMSIQEYIYKEFNIYLSPRHLDNLLLAIEANA